MFDPKNIWDYAIAVILAAAGGFARLLNKKDKIQIRGFSILAELFVSGFTGLMVMLFAHGVLKLSGDWLGLLCGMAGWIGARILNNLEKYTEKTIGLKADTSNSNDEQ